MGISSRVSTELASRKSSALHLRLAAFQVPLDGGEAVTAGEGVSFGVEEDAGGDPGSGGGCIGPATDAVGVRLLQHQRHCLLAGA
jgi:hypothetical protein